MRRRRLAVLRALSRLCMRAAKAWGVAAGTRWMDSWSSLDSVRRWRSLLAMAARLLATTRRARAAQADSRAKIRSLMSGRASQRVRDSRVVSYLMAMPRRLSSWPAKSSMMAAAVWSEGLKGRGAGEEGSSGAGESRQALPPAPSLWEGECACGSLGDAAAIVTLGTHPPAPSLWEGECVRSDSVGRGVMVSGVKGRADMVGSFPRVGWMIQGGGGGRDGEMKRRSGRGCAAWGWGVEILGRGGLQRHV